jgi:GTPase SAR1 family protein
VRFVLKDLNLKNRVPCVKFVEFRRGLNFIIGPPCSGKTTLIEHVYNNAYYENKSVLMAFPVIPASKILNVDFRRLESSDVLVTQVMGAVSSTTSSLDTELRVLKLLCEYLKDGHDFSLVLIDNISYYLMKEEQSNVLALLEKIPPNLTVVVSSLVDIPDSHSKNIYLKAF